jgi:hypothetical protein
MRPARHSRAEMVGSGISAARLIPEDLGIALRVYERGVLGVLGPCPALVEAVAVALATRRLQMREEANSDSATKSGGLVDYYSAGAVQSHGISTRGQWIDRCERHSRKAAKVTAAI